MARLGGDEFIVYRSGDVGPDDASADSSAILTAFQSPFSIMGESLSTNVSVGIVTSTDTNDELDGMMTKADLALYKAKGAGKAQAQLFHDEMDTAYRYRQRLKAELKLAVEAEALTLVYQPLIDLEDAAASSPARHWRAGRIRSWARSRRRCSSRSPRRPG